MADPIFIFRHVDCEGPGYLGEFLTRRGLPWQVIEVDQGDPVPHSIDGMAAMAFMGGPMSVNDPLPWIEPELTLIRTAQAAGLPMLGHCLGGQLIAKALGGTVGPNPSREIGWLPVRVLRSAATAAWVDGLDDEFPAFHWHGETFSIPEGADRLFESEACANQGFVIGNALALQCHIEMTAELVRDWAARYAEQIGDASPTVQSAEQMSADLEARITALHGIADRLYARWLAPLG
jgi:GMP synthase-like glutamine amidotransferase